MKFKPIAVYTAHHHKTKDKCPDIVRFVLSQNYLPVNPFVIFPSDILDSFKLKKFERLALDMKIMAKCDKLWIFGDITYGVSKEIEWWRKNKVWSAIQYFSWDRLEKELNEASKG